MSSKFTKDKAKYPAIIDKAGFCCVRKLRGATKPLPVTQALISARAMLEARIRGHVDFKASNGWFDHWDGGWFDHWDGGWLDHWDGATMSKSLSVCKEKLEILI